MGLSRPQCVDGPYLTRVLANGGWIAAMCSARRREAASRQSGSWPPCWATTSSAAQLCRFAHLENEEDGAIVPAATSLIRRSLWRQLPVIHDDDQASDERFHH